MSIKLLALDLDGTLTANLTIIPTKTQRAVQAAMDRGVRVTLATGRDHRTASAIARRLKLNTPLITYQGALIRDHRNDETWHVEYMPLVESRNLIRFARSKKLPLVMYLSDGIYTEFPTAFMEDHFAADNVPLIIVNNLLAALDDDNRPFKFLFVQPAERRERVYRLLKPQFGRTLTVVRSSHILVELLWPAVSKGRALTILADHLGIPLPETMAVGDHDNDASLLETAGLAVAMENGTETVKALADAVAPPVEREGVVWAIERYLLEETDDRPA